MNQTLCSLPFLHLATHPHGGVTLCCVSDFTNSMNSAREHTEGRTLNLNNNSIYDIVNCDYFKEVRLQMLAGKKPAACLRCYKEEEAGVRSKRIEENERFEFDMELARAITSDTGEIPVNFKFVELRLGNLCNIKCRTCNPASSTSLSTEYSKLQQELTFVTRYGQSINSSWTESDEFWDDLLSHCDDLQLLYINGGEPTLVEKHWKFLQRLIQRGLHKQVTLWYNINMTNLPQKLVDLWSMFKTVQVSCSIDDLGPRNSYLRSGTKWNEVVNNLNKLQSMPWIHTSICQTVSWMNAMYLNEFHEFMEKRNLHVHMNFVTDPPFLAVDAIPAEYTDLVMKHCANLEPWKQNMVLSHLNKTTTRTLLDRGVEYNNWLDNSRSVSLAESFPRTSLIVK